MSKAAQQMLRGLLTVLRTKDRKSVASNRSDNTHKGKVAQPCAESVDRLVFRVQS